MTDPDPDSDEYHPTMSTVPQEPAVDWAPGTPTILIPVAVLENETVPQSLVDFTAPLAVVVLGYHELPDQTAPGQARLQFEDRADEVLTTIATGFADAGADVETRLVFTPNIDQTVERVADELDCDAVLVPGTLSGETIESVFLPKRGPIEMDRVLSILATLIRDTDIGVTLYHAADDEDAAEDGRAMFKNAAEDLERKGIHPDRISTRVVVTDTPIVTVGEAARDHDLVLVGESEPTLAAILFGEVHDRVASAVDRPVIVIRRADHDDSASEGGL